MLTITENDISEYLKKILRQRKPDSIQKAKNEFKGFLLTEKHIRECCKEDLDTLMDKTLKRFTRIRTGNTKQKRQKVANEMLHEIKYAYNVWKFVIPLSNIKLHVRRFSIGEVTLVTFTKYQYQKYLREYRKIIFSNPSFSQKLKNIYLNDTIKHILEPCKGEVVALITVSGHSKAAAQKAYLKVKEAINSLRLFSYGLVDDRTYFGLLGEINEGVRPAFATTDSHHIIHSYLERYGPLTPLKIDKNFITKINKLGFVKLHELLKSNQQNDFDKRLIRSIMWFGLAASVINVKPETETSIYRNLNKKFHEQVVSMEHINACDRFIKCMISLESLFTTSKTQITKTIAERVAFVLGNDFESRTSLNKLISDSEKGLYGIRSKIIHNGFYSISNEDLKNAMWLVKSCLIRILKQRDYWNINSDKDLWLWVKRKKFKT